MRGNSTKSPEQLYQDRRERNMADGKRAEEEFFSLFKAKRSMIEDDRTRHVDAYVKLSDGGYHGVDIKTMRWGGKKKDDELWIELKNVHGKTGWLFGQAEYIAFGLKEYWFIVSRADLAELVRRKCGSTKAMVNYSQSAVRYKYYSRERRDDLVVLISIEDLAAIPPEVVKKRKGR